MSIINTTKESLSGYMALIEREQKEILHVKTATYTTIGGVQIPIDETDKRNAIDEIGKHYAKNKADYLDEVRKTVFAETGDAIRDYYAALPIGSAEDRTRAADIKARFEATNDGESLFAAEMEYHVNNNTVYALPFILAYRDLFGDWKGADAMFAKINPEFAQTAEAFREAERAQAMVEAFSLVDKLNNENDAMTRITAKRRLFELGFNPNETDFKGIINAE